MTSLQDITQSNAPFLELATKPADWWKLPLSLRKRWWEETDYGKNKPSDELAQIVVDVIAGKPYTDPNEQPPADQNNEPAIERDKVIAEKAKAATKTKGR